MTAPVVPWIDDDGWVHLHHPVTGGDTRVPNDPTVVAGFRGRGWEYAPEPVPEPEPDAPSVPDATVTPEVDGVSVTTEATTTGLVPAGTVADVLTWVAADPARATQALTVEQASAKPRTSLTAQLAAIAGTTPEA